MTREQRLARFGGRGLPELTPDLAVLPQAQADLWPRLGDIPEEFVLYGGTALALRLGHRTSVDFDFFADDPFVPGDLLDRIGPLGRPEVVLVRESTLVVIEPGGVQLSFFGGMGLQAVAEPSLVAVNGLLVASAADLAATKAKALLDRSEWKDYVDIATLLRHGHRLAHICGYAAAVFDRRFVFPVPELLRALVWFANGTAPDVPHAIRVELVAAVRSLDLADIPLVEPYLPGVLP